MFRIFLILATLIGCTPNDRNQLRFDPATGVTQTVSRDAEVFRDGKDHVNARTIILQRLGHTHYYLSLSVLRGGPNAPLIETIHQNGNRLRYRRHDRLNSFCIDHCHKTEVGEITLSKAQFLSATHNGITIYIDGRRRNYHAHVPARIFRTALDAAQKRVALPPP